jgi:uncharacterized protein YbaR (Trm112 family)
VKKRKRTTKKSHERTKGRERTADDGARVKKCKKRPNERHECARGHELIAKYIGREEDTEPTRELLLHAQACPNCAQRLRSLKPLVLFCLGESDGETPGERKVFFSAIRRELPAPGTGCRECAEVHRLIADCVSGEPNDGFPLELLLHVLSCPDCNWLMPILVQVVRAGTPAPSREMPMVVRRELWVTIQREIHTTRK